MKRFWSSLRAEFKGYNAARLGGDVMAGLTVCAVALPLALAFGVSSGASAASGLVTAIVAGVVIALLGGASYQVSGPTGAMSAVLVGIVARYGLQGYGLQGSLWPALPPGPCCWPPAYCGWASSSASSPCRSSWASPPASRWSSPWARWTTSSAPCPKGLPIWKSWPPTPGWVSGPSGIRCSSARWWWR